MNYFLSHINGLELAVLDAGVFLYLDIIIRCLYVYLAFFLSYRMYRLSSNEDYSEWKRMLCMMTGVAMTILLVHQILGLLVSVVLKSPSGMFVSLSKNFNMLSIPAIGVVGMMLTRHAILSGRMLMYMYGPIILFLVLGTIYCGPAWDIFNIIFTAILSTGLCVLGYLYYRRFNKVLREHYANTEVYDLSWLGMLLVMFLAAGFMRTLMAVVDIPGSHVMPLMVNMLIWYVMCRRVEDYEDAKVMGSIPSLFEFGKKEDGFAELTAEDDQLGEKIREACYDKKMIVLFDLNLLSLAEVVGCTKLELSQYFLNHHTTFFSYVNNMRLEYAAEMLKQGKESVQEVGKNAGFGFERVFKSLFEDKYGCSPSEYRKRHGQHNSF